MKFSNKIINCFLSLFKNEKYKILDHFTTEEAEF